jgi:hypothetical protein
MKFVLGLVLVSIASLIASGYFFVQNARLANDVYASDSERERAVVEAGEAGPDQATRDEARQRMFAAMDENNALRAERNSARVKFMTLLGVGAIAAVGAGVVHKRRRAGNTPADAGAST